MSERLQLHIPCEPRKSLFLIEKSCHLYLSSLGFQNRDQQVESLTMALQTLSTAFESRDFESLYRCRIGLMRSDGTIDSLTMESANTQLHGLNHDADGFKFGYEPDTTAIIDCFLKKDGTFVDVGANFGFFSIYVASNPGFTGAVHAFEPSKRGYRDLERLVSEFRLDDRIELHRCALGDSHGDAELLLSNSDGLTTMVAAMASRLEKVNAKQSTSLRTLDEFSLRRVDFIKIDVEGAEALVIAGGLDTIRAHTPVVVFESWSSIDDSGAFSALGGCGYQFFAPVWQTSKGHMSTSISDASDPTKLILVMFEPAERQRFPERMNIAAIHPKHIEQLQAD